jgi:hypothetical protein
MNFSPASARPRAFYLFPMPDPLSLALAEALRLEARRDPAAAAGVLDDAIARHGPAAPDTARFRALLLRAELAVTMNDLGLGRGVLAEARQVRLSAGEKESLAAEQRRADDLEAFLTHRGCAG